MTRSFLHTPEGVRDIYNQECAEKMELQSKLGQLMHQYGYAAIQTPTFEFFDIFGREIGTTPSKDLYKFFDREGNTLALRPDLTPSIARAVTKYFSQEEMPIRLWYQGNTFINNSSYQGRLKETTQLGAELIGDDSVDADAEVIALIIDALHTAGLKDFQITIGHADILKALIAEAGLNEESADELLELISNKNFFGVQELVEPIAMPKEIKQMFGKLGILYNQAKELEEVRALIFAYPLLAAAVDRLISLCQVLGYYGADAHVSLELGMISGFQYYTGIIFAGYTFGSGEPIVKGGRYDDLLPYFGKQAPSIGFAVVIDQLMAALSRQKITIPLPEGCRLIVYWPTRRKEAITKARALRLMGEPVLLVSWQEGTNRDAYEAYGARFHCREVTFLPQHTDRREKA